MEKTTRKNKVQKSEEEQMLTLHGRLRFARKTAGFKSQDAAAPLLEISKNTLNRYESGESIPDANIINKMVEMYNCNVNWLLTGRGPHPGATQELEACPLCGSAAEKLSDIACRCESTSCCMHKSAYPISEWQKRMAKAA